MKMESRKIENLIHYWILREEQKQRKAEIAARAARHPFQDSEVVPDYCVQKNSRL